MPELPASDGPQKSDPNDVLARAKSIYLVARDMGMGQRDDYLIRACGGDDALRAQVLDLLRGENLPLPFESLADDIRAAADRSASGGSVSVDAPTLQGSSAGERGEATRGDRPGHGSLNDHIGHYRLLERLGEGGFGIVFLAEQERPVRRRVALKIIKLGMDTRQVVARFEAERQALALMDHPNIARVFDAGATETGRPYFVMELVRGLPITEYCDRKKLSIRDRLALVSQVCDALQHAHQRGVIHRDIKPSNVLVSTIEGDKPLPKVIDFGIAKATSARLTEKTIFTEFRQMIGTPEYMSPEQAGQSADDVDTRTDVYAVGVLLYELLTGVTPFDSSRLRSAAFGEMQRIIREEDPPRPSTRVATKPETLATLAQQRSMPPTKLTSTIAGELDWIVMKALEKDRARRYDSAGSFAADIQRYLSGHAVQAAPPGRAYLIHKFVRRNKGPVLAGLLLTLALVAGLVGTSLGFFNAEAQRKVAVKESIRAGQEKQRADEKAVEAQRQQEKAEWQTYRANMSAAIVSLEDAQPARVRVRLDACPANLRGWEWNYVHSRLDMSKRRFGALEFPGMAEVYADLSPDGTTFVTPFEEPGTGRHGARIADARTGQERQRLLGGDTGTVLVATFNLEGTRVLTGSVDGSARVYDVADGREVAVLNTGTLEVRRATFDLAHDPRDPTSDPHARTGWIVTVNGDGWVCVFDEATHAVIARRKLGTVYTAFRIPGTRSIVFTQGFDPVMVWRLDGPDPESNQLEPLFPEYTLSNWAIPSVDGSRIAACYSNQVIRVIDLKGKRLISTIRGYRAQIGGMRFSPDGSRLLTATLDATVRLWDTASGDQLRVLLGHSGYIWSADFNADGSEILTGGPGAVLAWNTSEEDDGELLSTHGIQGYDDVTYSHSGDFLVTSSLQNGVRLLDARTHQLLRVIDEVPSTYLAISADGTRLASVRALFDEKTVSADAVQIWDTSTWKCLAVITTPESGVCSVALNADGSRIALSTWKKGGYLYDGRGELITALPGFDAWARGMKFTPDNSGLVAGMPAGHLFQWRAADGARMPDLPMLTTGSNTLVFGPGGTLLVSDEDGKATLWDVGAGKVIREFRGHGGPMRGAEFFDDGKRIVTAARDGTVRLWDVASGEEVAVFRTTRPFPEMMAVCPNGEEIAVLFDDLDMQFFRASPNREPRSP